MTQKACSYQMSRLFYFTEENYRIYSKLGIKANNKLKIRIEAKIIYRK